MINIFDGQYIYNHDCESLYSILKFLILQNSSKIMSLW